MYRDMEIKRGMVFWIQLGDGVGSVQGGVRPCCIVSNDKANHFAPTVTICPISTQVQKCRLPTHVFVKAYTGGLKEDSFIMTEQIVTKNKSSLKGYIGTLNNEDLEKLDKALSVSINIQQTDKRELTRQEIVVNEKVDYIRGLDNLIQLWIDRDKDLSLITEYIQEREIKLKDLERYCSRFDINYKDCYKPRMIMTTGENNIRMVG